MGGVRNGARNLIEVGDGSTFPPAGHLAAYAGLGPATRRSGSTSRRAQAAQTGLLPLLGRSSGRQGIPGGRRQEDRPGHAPPRALLLRDGTAEAVRTRDLGRGACGFAWGTTSSRTGWGGVLTPPGHGCRVEQLPGAETLGSSPHMDSLSSGDTRLFIRESKPGKSGGKLLIESEPPERETRKRKPGKHRGSRTRKSLIESETQD
ncbi:transposase, partial [Streptomyces erythrochromogenes]|uniref:transposase n=1 Tax=Streptomyces erythrochromogenes TaxID=285574 RepID=UPI0036C5A32C